MSCGQFEQTFTYVNDPILPRAFLVRHSSLNYREFKTDKLAGYVPATSIHPILNPFKLLA